MNKILAAGVSRRGLLGGAAVLAGAAAVAACSPTQIQQFETQWATVAGQIQNAVAVGAKYVPTVESIAATAANLFGPQYTALVTAGSAAFNQIVQALVNVTNNLAPPAAARLTARLAASSPNMPVTIGTTATGVQVVGWRAGI